MADENKLFRYTGLTMFKRLLVALVLFSLPLATLAKTPNDTLFGNQWYLDQIHAPTAWDTTTGNSELIIAVLDTGVDLNHPDLADNLWKNTGETPNNGKDDDGNGYIDDYDSWDFVDDDKTPSPEAADDPDTAAMSHGTFIAGLIGAETNNGLGYAGVMWDVKIMPLRILDEVGAGTEGPAKEAVEYAVANGASVINMSFAGSAGGTQLVDAVEDAYNAGVVVVAALGNNSDDVNDDPVYPACIQSALTDWVLGVTATDDDDDQTSFTNYGDDCADLAAPGKNILGIGFQERSSDSAYSGPWDGTSTASPLVAGAAGLLLSAHPNLSPEDVFTILKLSVDPFGEVFTDPGSLGVGRLNIAKALDLAATFTGEEAIDAAQVDDDDEPIAAAVERTNAYVALGAPVGQLPNVSVYKATGTEYATFGAYTPNFKGGVHVASADLDNDGIPEIVTGAGPGGGPHVRIFKPYGAVISEFFAYDASSSKGVNVAIADTDGDGEKEFVTSVGAGVTNDIVIWSQDGVARSLFPADGFAAGTPLAVIAANVDSDDADELVVFAETGPARVAVYEADGEEIASFIAFAGETGGVRVTAGDVDGDGQDEILTSAGSGANAKVKIYNKIGAYISELSFVQAAGVSLRLAALDSDLDGDVEIVVIPSSAGQIGLYSPSGVWIKNIGENLVKVGGGFLSAW